MHHKIIVALPSARRKTQPPRAVTSFGYIITASLRLQWEHRRGNCALRRSRLPIRA
jgi:hypothetical protein